MDEVKTSDLLRFSPSEQSEIARVEFAQGRCGPAFYRASRSVSYHNVRLCICFKVQGGEKSL